MRGSETVLTLLNGLLADELAAINQYMVHSEMLANWGYKHLAKRAKKTAITEMGHAEKLIERIIFLDGIPSVKLGPLTIGPDVEGILRADLNAEITAADNYNRAVPICEEHFDNVTRDLVEQLAKDEEQHVNYLESQLAQIAQMGLQLYLSSQA